MQLPLNMPLLAVPTSVPQLVVPQELQDARILVVDDEPANILLLRRILKNASCLHVESASNGREAVEICCQSEAFDVILLDLMMPERDGYGVLEDLSALRATQYLPVLVLTADANPDATRRALELGATDFLNKPFDHVEVMLRVKNLLETRFLTLKLREQNHTLEERVMERTAALSESYERLVTVNAQLQATQRAVEESQMEVLQRLAQAAELRDDDTGHHTQRVAEMAAKLAHKLEFDAASVEMIRRAAPLHDVGKIGISDSILLKPGKLTPEEFGIMKTHASIGAALLQSGQSPFVRAAETIALTHHERFDGTGYPRGLAGEQIPLEGRILAIVDVFDALTHERPYKKAWPIEEAFQEIEKQAGKQFDPRVVSAFLELMRTETPIFAPINPSFGT